MFEKCHCGTGLNYRDCCKPYIKGKKNAPTAEALMRSRYSAYVVGAIDYIFSTCSENISSRMDYESTKRWSEKATWRGFKILAVKGGEETSGRGTVHFEAYYEQEFMNHIYHEIANFEKENDRWIYVGGEIIPQTVTRIGDKVGRNDPCPCGKPKKYKHCCGK